MAGKIFVNYRRGDDPGNTGRLYDRMLPEFSKHQLFMDVEGQILGGDDFAEVLKAEVSRCDVLLAIIGPQWLTILDEHGRRRLDSVDDWVRIEIVSALESGKRVIPVLVGSANIPRAEDLPDDLKPLVRRHAVRISHDRFSVDANGLIQQIKSALAEARPKDGTWTGVVNQAPATYARPIQSDENANAEGRRPRILSRSAQIATPESARASDTRAGAAAQGGVQKWLSRRLSLSLAFGSILATTGVAVWLIGSEQDPDEERRRTAQGLSDAHRQTAEIMAAFGGTSPIVGREQLMFASDPKYVSFEANFNDPVLKASKRLSHPRSMFLVEDRLAGVDGIDNRSSVAHFVLGNDFKVKIALQIGYAGQKYNSFTARFSYKGKHQDFPLLRVLDGFYAVDDSLFDQLTIFGGQPSDGTKLYTLAATPRLIDRTKFFQAIEKAIRAK